MASRTSSKTWVLTGEAFNLLLSNLHIDRTIAADKYEQLRQKLIRFFLVKGARDPEESADEVFNRAARRLAEDAKELDSKNPDGYFLQIARFVFMEECRSLKKRIISLEELTPDMEPFEDPAKLLNKLSERIETEWGLEILVNCRAELSDEERLMIDVYASCGEGRERSARRKYLAQKLGKTINSLRIEVSRINTRIKKCAIENLEKSLGIKF